MSTPQFPGWYPDPEQPERERLWAGKPGRIISERPQAVAPA
jgi:hypothetical protein